MFRKALCACAVLWGAWSFAQPFSKAPLYYQEALRAFKKAKSKRVFRIQIMEEFQNAQLLAMLAFQAVQGKPTKRCIIIVANEAVASATAEHLAEHNVDASICFHQPYKLDPSKQVIICSAHMSTLFHQQFFNLKIIGRSAPARPSESSYVFQGRRISAKREVQVAPFFSTDLDVDYQYSMEQAHADGLTSSFEALMLPLPFFGNTTEAKMIAKLLAQVIKARHDWTPMVLYVSTVRLAKCCVESLRAAGLSAADIRAKRAESAAESIEVLVCSWSRLRTQDGLLPIRSIVCFSAHLDSATVPDALPTFLAQAQGEGRKRFVHVAFGRHRVRARCRLAALSLAYLWKGIRLANCKQAVPHLEEIADMVPGAFSLLDLDGKTRAFTEENLEELWTKTFLFTKALQNASKGEARGEGQVDHMADG